MLPAAPLATLIALAGAAAPAAVLHVALRHAMRARGLARWRLADTLLVSPLLFLSLFTAFGALAHALGRAVEESTDGGVTGAHLAGTLVVAAGAFVAAGFGARAIGKLY
ncbi:hypothetical protein tb265_13650 [Gemmatimonadetes bacterium T265]|nr:hypothetical protein tb265_13650 [Gemmatimonadetes bacterium T265]